MKPLNTNKRITSPIAWEATDKAEALKADAGL
jgi:hypothetical protein